MRTLDLEPRAAGSRPGTPQSGARRRSRSRAAWPGSPLLAVERVRRDPSIVERVSRRLAVCNLYVNRHITGAMVACQPFGGHRLSGAATTAGGPASQQFVEPRVVAEDTMRHGLVV